ncbi:MAG: hypothetical protein R3F61_14770 [Myxococcota bacterium]
MIALFVAMAAPADPPVSTETIAVAESEGWVAAGEVDGGTVTLRPEGFVPFGMIGTWAGVLASDTRFGLLRFAAGTQVRVKHGRLTHGTLAADTPLGGIPYVAGTRIELRETPSAGDHPVFRALLAAPLAIDGVTYPKGEELVLTAAGAVRFRIVPTGAPKPAGPLPCRWGAPEDRLLLHADGSVAQCILEAPHRFGTREVPALTVVSTRPDGTLERVDLHVPWTVDGEEIPAGRFVRFDPGGAVVETRSLYEADASIHRQDWRVLAGFTYGFPWNEVL